MTSWVYIFAQFTPEALLLEALLIFLLGCGYAAFWILRKRRYGVIDQSLPSGPVKSYLNELITNAEQLRIQLFGLLASSEFSSMREPNLNPLTPPSAVLSTGDPEIGKKLALLEGKMVDQTLALNSITAEKAQLEKELLDARTAAGHETPPSGPPTDPTTVIVLQEKITDLEGKLAEYSVIEDDLANLKRLQQENTQLKSLLTHQGIPLPLPTSPSKASTSPSPSVAPQFSQAQPASPPTPEDFSELVDPTENSLPSSTLPEPPQTDFTAESTAPPAPVKNETEKAEADLVAEFEKMLKG